MSNNTNPALLVGTSTFQEADVSFFPIVIPPLPELARFIQKQRILMGVAVFPPFVANRWRLYQEKGGTFVGKNIPLEIDMITCKQQYTPSFCIDFWDRTITRIHNHGHPKQYIIAPQLYCEGIIRQCLLGKDDSFHYYYHNPSNPSIEKTYYILSCDSQHWIYTEPVERSMLFVRN